MMLVLAIILGVIWGLSLVISFISSMSSYELDHYSKKYRIFNIINDLILLLASSLGAFTLNYIKPGKSGATAVEIIGTCIISFMLYLPRYFEYYSKHSDFMKVLHSKQKWIKKAANVVEKLGKYCSNDENLMDIYQNLITILNFCDTYKIPAYQVESVYEINLKYLLDAYEAYYNAKQKNSLCEEAIKEQTKEINLLVLSFKDMVDQKLQEIEEKVENGEYSNVNFFELHDKLAQLESTIPKETIANARAKLEESPDAELVEELAESILLGELTDKERFETESAIEEAAKELGNQGAALQV